MKAKLLFTAIIIAMAVLQVKASCNLASPTGLKLKNQTSCSIDVSWKKVTGASFYRIEYRVTGSGTWSFTSNVTGTSLTLSGLSASTSYDVAVASYCSDNTTLGYSAPVSKSTKSCTTPVDVSASSVTINSALISWTPLCGSNLFILQYRKQGVSTWTKVSNIGASSYELGNLLPATIYEFRVQANCGAAKSSWSAIQNFTTLSSIAPQKNIVLILLDDGRYDAYQPNGGPACFNTPAINRIADEGVNFKITIPTTSQCSPSRACIYTGVYPHINGVEKNGDTLNNSFPLVQQILKDHGYYTGFIGKYGQFLGDPKGFSWWAASDGDVYENANYTINGNDTSIGGHISDVYPQLAIQFLNSVPEGQSFALFYFTRIPHDPTIPRAADESLYTSETLPFPSNFSFYDNNYPSFYENHKWNANAATANDEILRTYQCLKGTEDNVAALTNWLEQHGILDSTLLIFTSDNGYLMGEHKLTDKILALEESIRLPLFMRYPKWFPANTIINTEIASNVDFATTFLDLAGIANTYSFQGISLRALANGAAHRKNFLYESGYDPNTAKLRAIRTLNDIFIRSYCKPDYAEEYYDLAIDPKEDSNLIFKPAYASRISELRLRLDSLRTVYSDIEPNKKNCTLITDGVRLEVYGNEESPELSMVAGPNPASSSLNIYFTSHINAPATLTLSNELGQLIWKKDYTSTLDILEELDCTPWSNGLYILKAEQGERIYSLKVVVKK